MANNYRQFCEELKYPEGNEAEAKSWWKQVVYTDPNDFDTPEEFDARLTELGINPEEVDTEHFPDFQCDLESYGVVIYSEGYGNVANVGEVVRAYLAKFMPDKVWSMEWCDYCDHTRMGEGSGGVLAVSDKEVLIKTTLDLRCELVAKLKGGVMFTFDEWIDLLICVQESIEREQQRHDTTTLESLKRSSQTRIDHLVAIKGRIRALLGKGEVAMSMREGMHVRHRTKEEMGIGTVLTVIEDEGLEVIRVQWKYEYGVREHIKRELSIFIPAGDEYAHQGRRW